MAKTRKNRESAVGYDCHFYQLSFGREVTVKERYGKEPMFQATCQTSLGSTATGTGVSIDAAIADMWIHHDLVESDDLTTMRKQNNSNTDSTGPAGNNRVRNSRSGDGKGAVKDPEPEPDSSSDWEPPDAHSV